MRYCCVCGDGSLYQKTETGFHGQHEHTVCVRHGEETLDDYCGGRADAYCSDCGEDIAGREHKCEFAQPVEVPTRRKKMKTMKFATISGTPVNDVVLQ